MATRTIILTDVTFGGLRIDAPGVVVYIGKKESTDGGPDLKTWRAQASFVPEGPIPSAGELRGTATSGALVTGSAVAEVNLTRNPSSVFIDVEFIGNGDLTGVEGA